MTKLVVAGSLLLAMVTLFPRTADAVPPFMCTVTSVGWQKYTSGVPTDLLMIGCSDTTAYASYIGTNAQVTGSTGCYATADAVKGFESLAISARLSGRPLGIYFTTRSCPGNAGQRSIDSVYLM